MAEADILERLPHRPPFRFISECLELVPGERARATWSVSGDESFFNGHFPGHPIVPGVLIGEALAQVSGLVAFGGEVHSRESDDQPSARSGRLAHLDLRWSRVVEPPALVTLESKAIRIFGPLRQFEVSASVDGTLVARGSLTLSFHEPD